jgi:hypothetical protein
VIAQRVRSFVHSCYDFVVGDDWRLAIGVIAGLGLTALLAHTTSTAVWWVAPVIVLVTLVGSTLLAGRHAGKS